MTQTNIKRMDYQTNKQTKKQTSQKKNEKNDFFFAQRSLKSAMRAIISGIIKSLH